MHVTLDNVYSQNIPDIVYKNEIDILYKIIPNDSKGNCLFESISYGLYGSSNNHLQCRVNVCNYYKTYNPKNINNTDLETRLSFNIDDDDHYIKVGNLSEWGQETDILVSSIIYKVIIVVFSSIKDNMYHVLKYCPVGAIKIIYLRYNGYNHYEAMIPTEHSPKPIDNQETKLWRLKSKISRKRFSKLSLENDRKRKRTRKSHKYCKTLKITYH